jgi:pimeloyl-ACP methyl ester carboxylesterase
MTAWVLLRGLTREARHWGRFPQDLQAASGEVVHALDLPGNGALWREASPWHVDGMVASARAQLQAQGAAPPYRLLAMSLGAMVATAWAWQHPQELAGGVLLNTSMRPHGRFTQRLRPRQYPRLLALALRPAQDPAWEATVLRITSNRPAPEGLLRLWEAWRRAGPVSRANALRQLVAAARFRVPDGPPPVPLRVLASRGDGLVDPACSRRLAQAWGCGFAEHPWAGHDLPLDDPDWVLAQAVPPPLAGVDGAGAE